MPAATHRIPVKDVDVRATLACGQTFRWAAAGDAGEAARLLAGEGNPAPGAAPPTFFGIAGSTVLELRRDGGALVVRAEPPILRREVERLFRLDDSYARILARISADPVVARAVDAYRGLRLLRQGPEEVCLAFLLSPASNIPRIARTLHLFARTYGRPVEAHGATFHLLPRLSELTAVGEPALRRLGAGFRARNIAACLRALDREELDIGGLRGRPLAEIRETLVALPGIGPKVADCIALFALDALGAFPVDVWVRRAVQQAYFRGRRPTDRRIVEWATERWGDDAGYAQQFLYHAARTGLLSSRGPGRH